MRYYVDVGIPYDARAFETGEAIETIWGDSESSGCGFGYRDLQIYFDTKEKADESAVGIEAYLNAHGYKVEDEGAYVSSTTDPETREEAISEGYTEEEAKEMFPDEDTTEGT